MVKLKKEEKIINLKRKKRFLKEKLEEINIAEIKKAEEK